MKTDELIGWAQALETVAGVALALGEALGPLFVRIFGTAGTVAEGRDVEPSAALVRELALRHLEAHLPRALEVYQQARDLVKTIDGKAEEDT